MNCVIHSGTECGCGLLGEAYLGQLLCVCQVIHSDGQEDIQQGVCGGTQENPTTVPLWYLKRTTRLSCIEYCR